MQLKFTFREMKENEAFEISKWHYEVPYDFYDLNNDLEDAREFLDFTNRPENKYFSVFNKSEELVGFYELTHSADCVEIGLGMRPDLTGKGMGLKFVEDGIDYIKDRFRPERLKLKVVSFNHRARKVYERAGFIVTGTEWITNDLGRHEFIVLEMMIP